MSGLRLVVMRHAKSSWATAGVVDHDRPLNDRGRRSAPLVADELAHRGWSPDVVLCSSAARTCETWALMAPTFPAAVLRVDGTLYAAGMGQLRGPLRACAPTARTVLVLGHNPGWEDVVGYLSGEHVTLTTANAALLSCADATWPDALHTPDRFVLEHIIRPREL